MLVKSHLVTSHCGSDTHGMAVREYYLGRGVAREHLGTAITVSLQVLLFAFSEPCIVT
jgi:hypothetical protein